MDERQWIHAIRKGDKRYLQDIAVAYYDDIYRFCAFQTGNREDAYDLAQETFLRFIRYIEGYHDRNLKGYLLTIAMNLCRNYLSKKRADKTVPFDENRQLSPKSMEHTSDSWQQTFEDRQQSAETQAPPQLLKDKGPNSEICRRNPEICPQPPEIVHHAPSIWRQSADTGQYLPDTWQQPAESPEESAVRADIHHRLMCALLELPEMQREAILLHYLQDMKYREIGKRTGVSVSTVKSRVRQGIEKLQKLLREEDF